MDPSYPQYVTDPGITFLDPIGRPIAMEDLVVTDDFNAYDFKQIKFTPFGDMLYRGRLFSSKENFHNLPEQLQFIYRNWYAPRKQGDFTTYRSNNQDSSSSSNDTAQLPRRSSASNGSDPNIDTALRPAVVDNTDSSGLLGVPLNIDGTIPLSQAYKQYEPRGFKLIADIPEGPLWGWTNTAAAAATLSRKRKQMGFSREEVVIYGGLFCTPCRPSNLSDPMLTTLFKQENFYNTTQEVYDVIIPALRLAEKFITDPALIGYWSTLAFGNRVIDVNLTAATGFCHERLVRGPPLDNDYYGRTLNLINRLGQKVEYRFEVDEDFTNQKCYGKTPRSVRKWNLAPEHHAILSQGIMWPTDKSFPMARPFAKDPWDDFAVVSLHPDFLTAARRFNATKNQDPAARLRFSFFFAVNIVHELAHVFEVKSSISNFEEKASKCSSFEDFKQLLDPRSLSGTYEAYWGNSPWAEAGGRWEWETFGGRVQPMGGRADASRGMMVFNADGLARAEVPKELDLMVGVCIQMGFMEEIQQQSFWARAQHSLKFPKTGAKAYFSPVMEMINVSDYLRDRDEEYAAIIDPVTDPADISMAHLLADAIAQEDPNNGNERPSKRPRLDDPSPAAPITRDIKRPTRRGRLRQNLMRKFPNKADAAAKATRDEAMGQMAHIVQQESAISESAPLPPGQQLLDTFLSPSFKPQDITLPTGFATDPYIDPVTKPLPTLTLQDKWTIAEEWVCFAMSWEPIEFQFQRVDHPTWRPAEPFDPDSATSFTEQAIQFVRDIRAENPGKSWPERRAQKLSLYTQKREVASRIAMMDELSTYLGFSRIECHRTFAASGKFPMGMTVANFPAYKPMLDAFRLTSKLQSQGEYISAVNRGMVSSGATGVGLIEQVGKVMNPGEAGAGPQTVKITDYFPMTSRVASTSTAPAARSSDPLAGFPLLTKISTPEELTRKYEAWIASGMDMRARPEGVHPAQLLSGMLGGSLRTVLPSELKGVVKAREREEGERKRREARERADAAEQRRGSGGESGSADGGQF